MARIQNTGRQGWGKQGWGKQVVKACCAIVLGVVLSASGPSCEVLAQGAGCSDQCRVAFGACYKATANRAACEQQMQRCLERCIQTKRY